MFLRALYLKNTAYAADNPKLGGLMKRVLLLKRLRCLRVCLPLLSAVILSYPSASSALTIERDFIGGEVAPNIYGAGNIQDVFNAAADAWEKAIPDEHMLTLQYGWGPVGGGTHDLISQGGTPNRETAGKITLTNKNTRLYLDPTPNSNEEFPLYNEYFEDFGAGPINTGRVYSGLDVNEVQPVYDAYSILLHEIGHALGLSNNNYAFNIEKADGFIDINEPLPNAGSKLPLALIYAGYTGHFDYVNCCKGAVMSGGPGEYSRIAPSDLDIIAIAQVSGFTLKAPVPSNGNGGNGNGSGGNGSTKVPEPTSALMLAAAFTGIMVLKRKIGA